MPEEATKWDKIVITMGFIILILALIFPTNRASAEEVKIDYENKCVPFSLAGGEILRLRTKITILKAKNLTLRERLNTLESISTKKVLKLGRVTKKGYRVDDYRHEYINYAFSLWGKNFVGLLEAENNTWNISTRSNIWYWRWWKKYRDYWFCQISNYYHPDIYYDKRFYTDWKWQIDQCYRLWRGGTKFYWAKNINRTILRFNFN